MHEKSDYGHSTAADCSFARRSRGIVLAALATLAGALVSVPASATVITINGTISGSGYNDVGGPGATAPTDPTSAEFLFQYDNSGLSGSGVESIEGLAVSDFDSFIDGANYSAADVAASVFFNNGVFSGFQIFASLPGIIAGTNDLFISFSSATATAFTYASINYRASIFSPASVTGSFSQQPQRLPLPATAWLFLVAAGGLLYSRRRGAAC